MTTKAADKGAAVSAIRFDREIDVRGYTCPIPALRARVALQRMESGQVLRVVSDDPGSRKDFRNFGKNTGHKLLRQDAAGRDFIFYFRKA
ncbi:MAG: sulfurtransferase TusA family protein [Betaproteobacteria bacterium]